MCEAPIWQKIMVMGTVPIREYIVMLYNRNRPHYMVGVKWLQKVTTSKFRLKYRKMNMINTRVNISGGSGEKI